MSCLFLYINFFSKRASYSPSQQPSLFLSQTGNAPCSPVVGLCVGVGGEGRGAGYLMNFRRRGSLLTLNFIEVGPFHVPRTKITNFYTSKISGKTDNGSLLSFSGSKASSFLFYFGIVIFFFLVLELSCNLFQFNYFHYP